METPNYKILSGSVLKLIAIITMTFDHVAVHLLTYIPACKRTLFSIWGMNVTIVNIFTKSSRLAFPIFCFLLVEGFMHTHNRFRYGRNLLLFALVSEIPWNLEHGGTVLYKSQNVFFTLFLGYLAMCAIEKFKDNKIIAFLLVMALFVVSLKLNADYGEKGFGLILVIYMMRECIPAMAAAGTIIVRQSMWVLPGFILMGMYNGKRGFIKGKFGKYFFYAYYPLHIFIIYLIKNAYFGF